MTFYQELQLSSVASKQLIKATEDKKERYRHILIYNFKVYLVMAFCVAVVSLYSHFTGNNNSVVGVTVLLAVLVLRQADFGIRTTHGLASIVGIFGILYIDMQEHPERYKGKVVEFVAKVMKPKSFPSKVFYPGRMAMTCCADDTSFLGYVCRSAYAPKLNAGDWVKIRAKVRYANLSVYGGEGPVLEAENIEPAEPIEELVYFN